MAWNVASENARDTSWESAQKENIVHVSGLTGVPLPSALVQMDRLLIVLPSLC